MYSFLISIGNMLLIQSPCERVIFVIIFVFFFSCTKFQIAGKLSTKKINMLCLYTQGQFTVGGLGHGLNQGPRTTFRDDFEWE